MFETGRNILYQIHFLRRNSYPVKTVKNDELQGALGKIGPGLFRLGEDRILLASFVPSLNQN